MLGGLGRARFLDGDTEGNGREQDGIILSSVLFPLR